MKKTPRRAKPRKTAQRSPAKRPRKKSAKRTAGRKAVSRTATKRRPAAKKKTVKRAAKKKTVKRAAKKKTVKRAAKKNAVKRAAKKNAVKKTATRRAANKTAKRNAKTSRRPVRKTTRKRPTDKRAATGHSTAKPGADLTPPRATPLGVRVGRFRPREAPASATKTLARPATFTAAAGSPKRAPFTQETWKEVDAAAARLGITELRSQQRHVIRALYEGRDALVLLPAGLGKSSTVLIAAQLLQKPVVVVSPRVSLLRAEHDRLLQHRIAGVRVDPSIHGAERLKALSRVAAGGSLVVLTTPDALGGSELSSALLRAGVALVAVDEAHTVSEWAHQFRPACARIGEHIARLGAPPTVALTSTATTATRHDIADRLGLRSPIVFETAPHQDNLALDVVEARGDVRQRALISLVMRLKRPGIIYCATPRDVEAVYGALRALRVPAHRYHGEMSAGDRGGEQLNFMVPGRRTVMVATSGFTPTTGIAGLGEIGRLDLTPSGFGMGVQKRDVRFVIHFQAPASLEQYVSEIALAGRDGQPATCVMFHEPADQSRSEALLSRIRVRPGHIAEMCRALESYAHAGRPATVEALALASGLSHRHAELLSAVLADAGLVTLSAGWVRVIVAAPALLLESRRLATRLETLEKQDARRLSAVQEYAASRTCRSLFLSHYFGVVDQKRCGRCGVCDARAHAFDGALSDPESAPRRRPPVRELSVTYVDRRGEFVRHEDRSSPLTAKLGDFAR